MKLKRVIVTLWLIIFFLSPAVKARAESKPNTFTFTPLIGRYIFECDQRLKYSPYYSLRLGYNFDLTWEGEAAFGYVDTESEKYDQDVRIYLYHLDGMYNFLTSGKIIPYFAAGLGGITLDSDSAGKDMDMQVNYGAGVKYFFNDTIALRGEARHLISFGPTYHNLMYSLGVSFYFGGKEKEVNEEVIEEPEDSDGDGVFDYLDKCPDTPINADIDSFGCPKDTDGDGVFDYLDKCPDTPRNVAVDSLGCPKDTDGDGVFDYLDKCPDTSKNVAVDSLGCPKDSDGDGVFDYLDKCPDTPHGATVDERGCWIIKGVLFDPDNWEIKSDAYDALNNIAAIMKKNLSLKLEIQGHTDNQGSLTHNVRLSENRARAVMQYLLEKGIDQSRLSAKGFWFSRPADLNDTPEGRSKNRRVELVPIF